MGYVKFAHLDEVYRRVKSNALKDGNAGASTVLIFVSPDADGICALKILVYLLKADCIAHKIVPVAGPNDLIDANVDHVQSNEELRSVIMLNCGGVIDLPEVLSLTDDMMVYICDSHRPLSLQSLFVNDQVMFLDDGDIEELSDLQKAVEELEMADSSSEEEDSESEDDQEGGDAEDDDKEGDGESSEGEDGDETEKRGKKGKRKQQVKEIVGTPPIKRARASDRRKRRKQQQRMVAEYYAEGAYFGLSVAGLLYTMATQLGRASNDFLWLSIIGLSDQYLHERIDHRHYLRQVIIYKDEVARFNLNSNNGTKESDDVDSLFGDSIPKSQSIHSIVRNADDCGIRCDDEFRLMLLRHWNLYESMYHSGYVATKLGIWKEKGRQRLTNLLVKMGLPHKESQQRFTEMNITFKRSLRDKLSSVAPRYNMSEIIFPSFSKTYGYKGTVSAPDVVYSITALLDWGTEWISRHSVTGYSDGAGPVSSTLERPGQDQDDSGRMGTGGLAGVGVGTRTGMAAIAMRSGKPLQTVEDKGPTAEDTAALSEEDRELLKKEQQRSWVRNFYVAYDALNSFDILQHGIQLSMNFQKVLVRTGVSILEKKLTQTLRTFQLTVLTGEGLGSAIDRTGALTDENDFALFGRSPAHLGRLAKFLMDAFREYRQKDLPLVIAALNNKTDAYLVLGITGTTKGGSVRRNTFGPTFQRAAKRANAQIRYDSFETSVVEVPKEDLTEFLENLQLYMQR
ncbi:CDC45 family [Phlyctochytrium arcticum]|nr:CDC45 family [Phlyctochytrium arcticum]